MDPCWGNQQAPPWGAQWQPQYTVSDYSVHAPAATSPYSVGTPIGAAPANYAPGGYAPPGQWQQGGPPHRHPGPCGGARPPPPPLAAPAAGAVPRGPRGQARQPEAPRGTPGGAPVARGAPRESRPIGGRAGAAAPMTYADVSRGIQRIFKERQEPHSIAGLEAAFLDRYGVSISEVAGISTSEYLMRKENVFEFDEARDRVFLQPSILSGPPIADPNLPKDEQFAVEELERLTEDLGPVCYVSALCGKFIQRNGVSVTSITNLRPLDLLKRYPDKFLVVGGGNVALAKNRDLPEVQAVLSRGNSKAQRTSRARQDAQIPLPEVVTEEAVVEEFKRLILQDGEPSVYISSLCGRFLQRFRKPVTAIISSRPADFLRKYPDVFELVGGGNVRLREPGSASAAAALGDGPEDSEGFALAPMPEGVAPAAGGAALATLERLDDDICAQILGAIAPPGLGEWLRERMQELSELLRERCFLSIEEVLVGGAVGKGIATLGAGDAEVVLFVGKLPDQDQEKWLPHVLETLLAVLDMALGDRARGSRTSDGLSAQLTLLCEPPPPSAGGPEGDAQAAYEVHTTIFIVPILEHEELLRCLRTASPPARRYYAPALSKGAVELVRGQPEKVRAAMQLVRWWAAQQQWQSPRTTPAGYLLELITIHASVLLKAEGPDDDPGVAAVAERALELCAGVAQLRVLWGGTGLATYPAAEVPLPLAAQSPLVLDPANPCSNAADPELFDGFELAARASAAGRLGCFSRFAGGSGAV